MSEIYYLNKKNLILTKIKLIFFLTNYQSLDENGNGDDYYIDEDEDVINFNEDNQDIEPDVLNDEDFPEEEEDFFNERQQQQQQSGESDYMSQEADGFNGEPNYLGAHSKSRHICKFCSFVAKSPAKLQLHLATHYNLKPFMCPICKRRANFKWDIQKHLRKIHNDHTSEVICLTEAEARKSIGSYIEHKQFSHTNNSNAIIYENSFDRAESSGNESGAGAPGAVNGSNFRFFTNRQNAHVLKERKFKCSLCMRTSKWQWDIKKHLRTVHKGRVGDVITLKETCSTNTNGNSSFSSNSANIQPKANLNNSLPVTLNSFIRNNNHNGTVGNASGGRIISNSLFKNSILNAKAQQLSDDSTEPIYSTKSSLFAASSSIGSDATGNKKFKCKYCPYRSNWKADLLRHIKKRHNVAQPTLNNVVILGSDDAANTLAEYERVHGINIRKRSKMDIEGFVSDCSSDNKRMKIDSDQDMFNSSQMDNSYQNESQLGEFNESNAEADNDGGFETSNGVERLPVSVAELNIKPYKCLKCGFRSDRKSDTLRHIKVKHCTQQPFSLLKILSIKEASDTIEQYERLKGINRKSRPSIPISLNSLNSTLNNNINNNNNRTEIVVNHAQANTASRLNLRRSLPNEAILVNNNNNNNNNKAQNNLTNGINEHKSTTQVDYYKCPFCVFKHANKMSMRRHLLNHYEMDTIKQHKPVYRCNTCSFKSQWQFSVKKHIVTSHLGVPNANVVRVNRNKKIPIKFMKKTAKLTKPTSNSTSNKENDCSTAAPNDDEDIIEIDDENENEQEVKQAVDNKRVSNVNMSMNNVNTAVSIGVACNESLSEKLTQSKKEKSVSNINHFYEHENEEFIHYDDNNDEFTDANDYSSCHNENSMNISKNDTINNTLGEMEGSKLESISLTGFDGVKFTATYMVAMVTTAGSNNTSANGQVKTKKKMFYCQTCPYKTNNYCNLKQHLLQHKFQEGYYKCRYCSYYVVMIRLLKQHETLHSEYEPREEVKKK